MKQNSSFCTAGYLFLWPPATQSIINQKPRMLMTSMICQAIAGTAFARIHVGAAQQMGGVQQVSKIIGCSGILLIASTFGASPSSWEGGTWSRRLKLAAGHVRTYV